MIYTVHSELADDCWLVEAGSKKDAVTLLIDENPHIYKQILEEKKINPKYYYMTDINVSALDFSKQCCIRMRDVF